MEYFGQKLSEVSDLFDGELELVSKSEQIIRNTPDYIDLGRHRRENQPIDSPGLELTYQTRQEEDLLVVYVALLYKLNSIGKRYPHDLVVAADFEKGRFNEFTEAFFEDEDTSPFLFAKSLTKGTKRTRFNQISELDYGTSIRNLMEKLDRTYASR